MAANTRNSFQRELDLKRITDLYLEGWTQAEIAAELRITQQQVSYDLKVIKKRWQALSKERLDAAKQMQLARIDKLEREAWAAWRRSLEEKIKTSAETKGDAPTGNGAKDKPKATRTRVEKEQLLGNPAYMTTISWCVSERCKILGLYAPTRNDNLNYGVDFAKLTDDQLARIAEGEDVIAVILSAYADDSSESSEG